MRHLPAVGHADHVVLEDDAAHPRQLHAQGLENVASADLESLLAADELPADFLRAGIEETPVGPVSVGSQDGGQLAGSAFRTIQTSRDEMPGITLEIDLLDGVALAIDTAVDDRMIRRFRRHGPQAGRHQDLPPHLLGALLPRFASLRRNEREIPVFVFQRFKPRILRQLSGGQHPNLFGPDAAKNDKRKDRAKTAS